MMVVTANSHAELADRFGLRHLSCVRAALLAVVVASSACTVHPPFAARSDAAWLAFDAMTDEIPYTILTVFAQGAKDLGCSYDRMCTGGFKKTCYGVTAYCWDHVISVIARADGRFSVGCLRPTSIEQCGKLLNKVMRTRSPLAP